MLKDHSMEFLELKKSIYYNLALIFKEKGEVKTSLYFFFSCYKLNPENVSIIVEIAIMCKKELMIQQSLYFFELAYSKDTSPAMRLVYQEQAAVLNFILDDRDCCLKKIESLIRYGYKINELYEFRNFVEKELDDENKHRHDFFSSHYEYAHDDKYKPSTSSSIDAINYMKRLIEMRRVYMKRRYESVPHKQLDGIFNECKKPQVVRISLVRFKWRDLLASILAIIRVHNLQKRNCSYNDIRLKVEQMHASKMISTYNFDIFECKFAIDTPKPSSNPDTILPLSVILDKKHEDSIKERPREDRYNMGQMSLREKKSHSKPSSEQTESYNQSFDRCFQLLINSLLEPKNDKRFMLHELRHVLDIFDASELEVLSSLLVAHREHYEREVGETCGREHQ